jgi:hypothetical protein
VLVWRLDQWGRSASHFLAAPSLTEAEGEQIISFRAIPNVQCSQGGRVWIPTGLPWGAAS